MIKYKEGNLIELFEQGELNVIAHQCNCFHLGGGIAKALVDKYPEIQISPSKHPLLLYGTTESFMVEHGLIYNLYSQFGMGPCEPYGIDSYPIRNLMLDRCLRSFNSFVKNYNSNLGKRVELSIGFPLIASGIAADRELKGSKTDFEYFETYIAPLVARRIDIDINVIIFNQ